MTDTAAITAWSRDPIIGGRPASVANAARRLRFTFVEVCDALVSRSCFFKNAFCRHGLAADIQSRYDDQQLLKSRTHSRQRQCLRRQLRFGYAVRFVSYECNA